VLVQTAISPSKRQNICGDHGELRRRPDARTTQRQIAQAAAAGECWFRSALTPDKTPLSTVKKDQKEGP
jgi:hypothetical protein